MAEVMKFGGSRERRPNPLVELHPAFLVGEKLVPAYVTITKFDRDGKDWDVKKFNVTVGSVLDLISDLKGAYEASEDAAETISA